jgi:hypothetical protein
MTQEEYQILSDLLEKFRDDVLECEMGDSDDRTINNALLIVDEYMYNNL